MICNMDQGGIEVPANNIVRLTSNGVILLVLTGQQTKQSVDAVYVDLSLAIKKQREQKKPALVLTDIDHLVHSPKAEEAANEALKVLTLPFDVMAVCYGTPESIKLAQTLAEKSGSKSKVRTFTNAKEASRWLAKFIAKP